MKQPQVARAAGIGVVVALALTAAACSSDSNGDDSGDVSDGGTGEVVPGSATLSIADLAFEPTTLPIASGSTDITVTNADSVDHTFTLDDDSLDQAVATGETVTVTVDLTESTGFHCEIHPSMTGTLQVA